MLSKHYTNKIIFLNIETVPQYAEFENVPPKQQDLFRIRYKGDFKAYKNEVTGVTIAETEIKDEEIWDLLYEEKAALTPEFGKTACVSFLALVNDSEYRAMTISDPDEKKLLEAFLKNCPSIADWPKLEADKKKAVCSYSGFGFTWPFIAHRFLLNYLPIPAMFDYSEGKPWEQEHLISLMNVWNYNRSSSYTSLATLCNAFNVEHSDFPEHVAGWYHSGDLQSLKDYSTERVVSLATVYLRIKGITNNLTKAK